MHRKRARRIWGILKKSVELSLAVRRRRVTFACSLRPCGGYHTCWGWGRWKSQNRKNVYLSPNVEEPLNSKVIKSFVSELRSRKCFSCFGIPMFYVYMLWTFYVRFPYPYLVIVPCLVVFAVALLCTYSVRIFYRQSVDIELTQQKYLQGSGT